MHHIHLILSLAIAVGASATSLAATIWNEAANGSLSGNRLAPSSFTLAVGDNDILGTVQGGTSSKLDYVTLTVPVGTKMVHLDLVSYASTDQKAFIGVQRGTTFTEPASGTNVANLLGWTHFGPGAANVGADILPSMGLGPGAQDFTAPLPPNQYTFWIQQLGAATNFDFDFVVQPVPEPSSVVLIALGSLGFLAATLRVVSAALPRRAQSE
jgi:hypothetical protein